MRIRYCTMLVYIALIFIISVVHTQTIHAADWPQFRGPERDGISPETGLLKQWPANGPALVWSTEILGAGYSSPVIVNNHVYVTGMSNDEETVFAFDADGNLLWKTSYGPPWKSSFEPVRTTPTVDGDLLYVVSGMGNVACLQRETGDLLWQVQAVEKFNGDYHRWGISDSPLIVEDKVIVTPGGKNASLVALHKKTGDTIWTTKDLSEQANYCNPLLVERGDKNIIATQLQHHFVGIDARTGDLLWKDAYSSYLNDPKDINPITPIYADGRIYVTSGYDDGGAMYDMSQDGSQIRRVWTDKVLDVHIGGAVKIGNYIYGSNWENNRDGNWVCLDWNTGEVQYETTWKTKGSVIAADGMLYCYEEKDGTVGLVKANPDAFTVISSFQIPLGSKQHWAHPAISNGRLYIRHGEALMVYDINAK